MKALVKISLMIALSLGCFDFAFGATNIPDQNSGAAEISENGALASGLLEARAVKLFREVKCPICVSQSVAESDAEISKTLREHIRREISLGKSDGEILDEMRSRYGEAILLNPRVGVSTLPLWMAPWFFLLLGFYLWRRAHTVRSKKV